MSEAVIESPGPRSIETKAEAFEAHSDVLENKWKAVALFVDHPVQEFAQVGEHDLGLGVVVLIVSKRQDGKDPLGCGRRISTWTVLRPWPDVDHVVVVREKLRLVPGGQRQHFERRLSICQGCNRFHRFDFFVAALRGHDEDAFAVQGVLKHRWPKDGGSLSASSLSDDVAVHAFLALRDVNRAPTPKEQVAPRSHPDEGRTFGPAADGCKQVKLRVREAKLIRFESGPCEPSDHLVVPEQERETDDEDDQDHGGENAADNQGGVLQCPKADGPILEQNRAHQDASQRTKGSVLQNITRCELNTALADCKNDEDGRDQPGEDCDGLSRAFCDLMTIHEQYLRVTCRKRRGAVPPRLASLPPSADTLEVLPFGPWPWPSSP